MKSGSFFATDALDDSALDSLALDNSRLGRCTSRGLAYVALYSDAGLYREGPRAVLGPAASDAIALRRRSMPVPSAWMRKTCCDGLNQGGGSRDGALAGEV